MSEYIGFPKTVLEYIRDGKGESFSLPLQELHELAESAVEIVKRLKESELQEFTSQDDIDPHGCTISKIGKYYFCLLRGNETGNVYYIGHLHESFMKHYKPRTEETTMGSLTITPVLKWDHCDFDTDPSYPQDHFFTKFVSNLYGKFSPNTSALFPGEKADNK